PDSSLPGVPRRRHFISDIGAPAAGVIAVSAVPRMAQMLADNDRTPRHGSSRPCPHPRLRRLGSGGPVRGLGIIGHRRSITSVVHAAGYVDICASPVASARDRSDSRVIIGVAVMESLDGATVVNVGTAGAFTSVVAATIAGTAING